MSILKIALIGYGSMGKQIRALAASRSVEVTKIFEADNPIDKNSDASDFEVAIDFSYPSAALDNAEALVALKKNFVVGVTGLGEKKEIIKRIVEDAGAGCVYGSNFSIGANILFKTVAETAKLLNSFEDYDAAIIEAHHRRKKDAPSGTALKLAEILLENLDRKEKTVIGNPENAIAKNALQISSLRLGEVYGTHSVIFDSLADSIEITHKAKNRAGFALGALAAAKWIRGKKGFYEFEEVFDEIVKAR